MKLSAPIYLLKRQAKQLSRKDGVSLNEALNNIARREGFESWSLLAARYARRGPATKLLAALNCGDLVLLGARPGHGKTLMGIELIVESIKAGKQAAFYSLEYTETEIAGRFVDLGADINACGRAFTFDISNEISADYIIGQLKAAPNGTIVVIDYLQLLDQDRQKPILKTQVSALKSFAQKMGLIIIMLSQIDRSYDPTAKPLPDMSDVRLPNPLDLRLFSKMIFLNNGDVNIQAIA
ncbi:MAG: DNA helicase [Paracoccaceae bacterium]